MKRITSLFLALIMMLSLVACSSGNESNDVIGQESAYSSSDESSDVIGQEINFAKKILVAGTSEKVEALFPNHTWEETWILIDGTLSGLNGQYEVFFDDDTKEIEDLIFRHSKDDDLKPVIKSLNGYLGKYVEHDKDNEKYTWENEEIGLEIKLYENDDDIWFEPMFDYEDEQKRYCSQNGHSSSEWSDWNEDYDNAVYVREKVCLICDEELEDETKELTTLVNGNTFVIHPYGFADRFEIQSERLNNIDYECEVEYKYGDDIMYYLSDDNTIFYRIKDGSSDVGMFNFYDADGKALSRRDDFDENKIAKIDILVEDTYDLAAVLYTTLLTIDPAMDYSYAAEFGQSLQDNIVIAVGDLEEGAFDGVDYNGVNYLVYRDREYCYIVLKPSENAPVIESPEEIPEFDDKTKENINRGAALLGKELVDGNINISDNDYEFVTNEVELFGLTGMFTHGYSFSDDVEIINIMDWISSEPVDNYKGIVQAFINEYGENYREQYYDDAGKNAYMWKDKGGFAYIICWQNDDGTIDIRWTI